ncbi:hypothetical protein QT196_16305 [Streptomyces sp. P9-2B-2]|uniref:hypothetical protein n=1 Tax=Streptomyces sp. P9-2B-2 TaxID=3057114 RepID=UPI0025B2F6C7|nr:hypothetical protein [Streptomyces sp. P9-2B-2]WJY38722.1 hypothetical protein QT196_16305 [Streptomyces sp. P9-2B-2]
MATTKKDVADWISDLTAAGMLISNQEPPQGAPEATAALHIVNGIDAEPTVSVDRNSSDSLHFLNHHWKQQSEAAHLYSASGGILVCSPATCPTDVGWLRVQDPMRGDNIASRLVEAKGSPTFLALSEDRRHLCAISVEDEDYWIVRHEF